MMIFLIGPLSLILSLFLPWFYIAVLAALLATSKKWSNGDAVKMTLSVLVVHVLTAGVLDHFAKGLVSLRIAPILSLPAPWLLYVLAGLVPALLFFSTIWVISSGRNLVKRQR